MTDYTVQELNDMGLRVEVLKATEDPQTLAYSALIQDYSEGNSYEQMFTTWGDCLGTGFPVCEVQDPKNPGMPLSEKEAGLRTVKLCMWHRHFGPLEHPSITLNIIGFPHSMGQQWRTHRIASFDVQSGRYTGDRIEEVGKTVSVEDVYFLRPVGFYSDRHGHKLDYTEGLRNKDLKWLETCSSHYRDSTAKGYPYELARDIYTPYSIRQNFVFSANLRSLLHILEMRSTKDAELECQWASKLILDKLDTWAPQIIEWWKAKRYGKNQIAP